MNNLILPTQEPIIKKAHTFDVTDEQLKSMIIVLLQELIKMEKENSAVLHNSLLTELFKKDEGVDADYIMKAIQDFEEEGQKFFSLIKMALEIEANSRLNS